MPDNADIVEVDDNDRSAGGANEPHKQKKQLVDAYMSRKSADSANWKPELPELVGIYHAYVRNFNLDSRSHRLFIVTSGGCSKLADTYYNLFVDARNGMTAWDVAESEETWYARNAHRRNNAMVIKMVADEFKLPLQAVQDPYSHEPREVAVVTTETIQYDLLPSRATRFRPEGDTVSLYSRCAPTALSSNGTLCTMHASEGVWLYRGPVSTNYTTKHYGGPFGSASAQTCLPTSTVRVSERGRYNWRCRPVKVCPPNPAMSTPDRQR